MNYFIPLILLFILYLYYRTDKIDEQLIEHYTKIENIPFDCEPVRFSADETKRLSRAKKWSFDIQYYENELFTSNDVCATIRKYFTFLENPLTAEEADYPLAYGLVVYKNLVQVLLQMSIFYQPQHTFCITIDRTSNKQFQKVLLEMQTCFPNIKVIIGDDAEWGTIGILNNVYSCFNYLANTNATWYYYQYLSGTDLPMRTNLEMVRIFKALNGSINTDVDEYELDRYKNMAGVMPPVPVYKSSMSVAIPRHAARFITNSATVKELLKYLEKTDIPDESFWTSVSGSPALLPVPGSFKVKDIMWLRKNFRLRPSEWNTVDHVGTSYIGRYQVWDWQGKPCYGFIKDYSCVFGVGDMEEIMTRPELVAHKIYLDYEPAAFMCLMKEIRQRSTDTSFNASSYSQIPTVELSSGVPLHSLTHPSWLVRSSFYDPRKEDLYRTSL